MIDKKIKILILEDSPTQAVKLEYFLEESGFVSATTDNGIKALEYLKDSKNIKPDIILSDIVMPEMNGFEFCYKLKNTEDLKNIPVILLTSLSDPEDVISGLECGADNFITKPYKDEYLLSKINYIIENSELRINNTLNSDVKIKFAGKEYNITSEKEQILDLLFSSFENAIQKNTDLKYTIKELKETQKKLITANKEAEDSKKKLNELATYDSLTGLYNRRALEELADKMLLLADRRKIICAIVHLDIDNFKSINDSLGHGMGDEVLKETSSKLIGLLRGEDICGRIGGDEFAILLIGINNSENVRIVSQKIINAFKKPIHINNETILTSVSIGVSLSNFNRKNTYAELLQEADLAMYNSKKKGKSQYSIFDDKILKNYKDHLEFENELISAQKNDEFSMVYQPIIDLKNKHIIGFESLMRWNNKKFGPVEPSKFIPFAEMNKQIHEIGIWILDTVMKQCSLWFSQEKFNNIFITINISPVQFERKDFLSILKHSINKYDINPKCIIIEITETAYSQFLKTETLLKMKEQNILMAIDDFGSGYSSMQRLLELPIDYMKIDGFNVRKLSESPKYKSVCKNILSIAKSLNIKSIAECVETENQAEFLLENDCEYAQGYLFHKPLKPEEISELEF